MIRSAEAFLLGTMQEEIWNAWNTKTDRALRYEEENELHPFDLAISRVIPMKSL